MNLQEATINKILEARSSRWETIKQFALDKGIPNEDVDAFVDYIYQIKSAKNQLYVRKSCIDKLVQAIGEPGTYFKTVNLSGFDHHIGSSVDYLETAYGIIIKDFYDKFKETYHYENNTEKRVKVDLQQGLLKARKILTDILGTNYMIKNDKRPNIIWEDLGEHTLGSCANSTNMRPLIRIHTIFKYNQELTEKYFMDTVIHEYIHSLRSCVNCHHEGEFKRIADLVTNNTSYFIDVNSGPDDGQMFGNVLRNHSSEYNY